jgi:hypothetical protein
VRKKTVQTYFSTVKRRRRRTVHTIQGIKSIKVITRIIGTYIRITYAILSQQEYYVRLTRALITRTLKTESSLDVVQDILLSLKLNNNYNVFLHVCNG